MRIDSFWAKNYRSLRNVRLDGLGSFNIFYGPNGAGKSNILAGLSTLFGYAHARTAPPLTASIHEPASSLDLLTFLPDRERFAFNRLEPVVLGAELSVEPQRPLPGLQELPVSASPPARLHVTLELTSDAPGRGFRFSRLEVPGADGQSFALLDSMRANSPGANSTMAWLHEVTRHAFVLVGADRALRNEVLADGPASMATLLARGQLKQALFRAKNQGGSIRPRYQQLQKLLAGEPLERSPFDVTYDPDSGKVELVEVMGEDGELPHEIPLELAGLGISQVYSILAQILLSDADAIGIEEPEAHLHAPSTGVQLRKLLERVVGNGYIEQLFIATHSNLFDLDQGGYFDVSYPDKQRELGTCVQRENHLAEIDRRHLVEPGPAKHALTDFLRYLELDEIVFRQPDGSPVSVAEMLDMLQRNDPRATAFLEDVHDAAVHAVRVKRKRQEPS